MEVVAQSLFNWTGESPYWDQRTQELSFVDGCISAETCRIFRWNSITKDFKSFELDECTSFNIPSSDTRYSIVSCKNKIVKFDWHQKGSSNYHLLTEVDEDQPLNRLNDGKCDRNGVLIAGTMSNEKSPGVVFNQRKGSLFKYKYSDENATKVETGFDLSNGIDWNLDYSRMFFADSCFRTIFAFDYDTETSTFSNKRTCIDFSQYSSDLGLPDGITTDINNRLWVACFFAGKVVQFDLETGSILQEIKFPTACITSCCFGGPYLTDMYVTTSKFGVGNDPSKGMEHAGSLFKVPGSIHGTSGNPMNYFQL